MITRIFTFLFVIPLCISPTLAQDWTAQNSQTGRDLQTIFFLDSLNGWTMGEAGGGQASGSLRQTSDQGINWNPLFLGQENAELNSSFFMDGQLGFGVGRHSPGHDEGLYIRTQDGGLSWTVDINTFETELFDIHFVDSLYGWIVGEEGVVYKTQDAGQTWIQLNSPTEEDLMAVRFITRTLGLLAGEDGRIYRTLDGGQSWSRRPANTDRDLHGLSISGQNHVYAVGDNGTIVSSLDAGLTWQRQNSQSSRDLTAVSFVSPDTGWVVGKNGTVLHTTDGGLSWQDQNSGTGNHIWSIYMVSGELGWFCGQNGVLHIYSPTPSSTLIADFSSASSICLGEPGAFQDLSQGSIATWRWDFGDSLGVDSVNSPSYLYSQEGIYQVSLIVRDSSGNQDSISKTIEVFPARPQAAFTISDSILCLGDTVFFFDQSSQNSSMWNWDFGDGSTASISQNPIHFYSNAGNYHVQLITGSHPACQDTLVKSLQLIDPQILASPVSAVICSAGDSVSLSASGGISYQWSPATGINTDTASTIIASPMVSTDYVVFGTDGFGCVDSATVHVSLDSTSLPVAAFTYSDPLICGPGTIQFQNQSLFGNTFEWSFPGGMPASSMEVNPIVTYDSIGLFDVSLIVSSCSGIDTLTMNQLIEVGPEVRAGFVASLDTVDLQNQMQVDFLDNSLNPATWLWDFGNGDSSQQQNPSTFYQMAGIYTVRLEVSNGSCTDQFSQDIVVLDSLGAMAQMSMIAAPNPMTEISQINIIGLSEGPYEFYLYDMRGNLLKMIQHIDSRQFELKRENLDAGIYIYRFSDSTGRLAVGKIVIF